MPAGLYDRLLTEELTSALDQLGPTVETQTEPVSHERAPQLLARHLATVAERLLASLKPGGVGNDVAILAAAGRAALLALDAHVAEADRRPEECPTEPLQLLTEVKGTGTQSLPAPLVPLSESALLVNEPGEPSLGTQLQRELESADRVDLLCAFINWHGVRLLEIGLRSLLNRGGRIRILTSTYMGATQRRALDRLVELGAEVRVAYDTPPARTRLHAKAWLFHRATSFTTVYIGSSNLSHSALLEGVEWNVRLSAADAPGILTHFETMFGRYWADPTFQQYDPTRDAERLDRALGSYSTPGSLEDRLEAFLDVTPWPHQQAMLDQLDVERRRNNWRNLIVAATGTGKTVIAALDFRRLRKQRGELSLLFVAHQERILRQARRQFRNVLRDSSFGELLVDGERPQEWRHVFASIQSLSSLGMAAIRPDQFQMVILDEMHHVAAASYSALMEHLEPQVLLGLSATPERADGEDTLRFFGDRISAELRLWDALDSSLLCPFHYFGLPSDLDLRHLTWDRGGYRESELEQVYLDADREERVRNLLAELSRLVPDIHAMRALGFCVSVKHAQFMAASFNQAGLSSEVLSGNTPTDLRERAIQALRRGELRVLFTVNLFNEGVDIPEVDTLLLLRPTASATVFIQQLGRGLRLCEGKPCVTVLDFIGQHHRRFRFDRTYRALTGLSLAELERSVREGFSRLPSGCHLQLEREPRETILTSLRNAIPRNAAALRSELRALGDVSLLTFLNETGAELGDLYSNGRTYTELRRSVGFLAGGACPDEETVSSGLERLLDLDDPDLLIWYQERLRRPQPEWAKLTPRERRMLRMLLLTLWPEGRVVGELVLSAINALWELDALIAELADLCAILVDRSKCLPRRLEIPGFEETPLQVHCSYSRNEVLAALDVERPSSLREGVRYFEPNRTDLFFVTLRKHEREYSPSTLYHDYVLSPEEFHWESQSQTRETSTTGQRYIRHREQGSNIMLFCREGRKVEGRTARYVCLGLADYLRHHGERPMQIVWRLQQPIPAALYERFRAAAG